MGVAFARNPRVVAQRQLSRVAFYKMLKAISANGGRSPRLHAGFYSVRSGVEPTLWLNKYSDPSAL